MINDYFNSEKKKLANLIFIKKHFHFKNLSKFSFIE